MSSEASIVPYHLSPLSPAQQVLVFAPHPDDEVFGCGGAIALHAQAGHAVRVVLLTAGDFHTQVNERDTSYAATRLAESQAAAALLGAENVTLECWNIPDRGVAYGETLVQRMADALQTHAADVVYAPSLWESHPDHRAAGMSVLEAVRRHGQGTVFLYEVSAPARPNYLLNVSDVWAQKMAAMQGFTSQNSTVNYPDFVGSLNRYRALTVGNAAQYVEAFERYAASDLTQAGQMPFESEHRRLLAREIPSMAQDMPLVSVVIRTTARETLMQTLDSLLAQTHSHLEVVLVDVLGTGLKSVDTAFLPFPVRIASNGKKLPRAQAANVGLDAATGDFCLFLDDDDWLYPDHIAKLVRAAVLNPNVKAVHTGVRCVDGLGKPTGVVFDFPYAPRELCYGNFMPIHAVLFRRDLPCRFDETFDLYEDWDFWLQIESHTAFAFVAGISAAYRVDAVSGAGVQVDAQRGKSATAQIFQKWNICRDESTFDELVFRALSRRHAVRRASDLEQVNTDLQTAVETLRADAQAAQAIATAQATQAAHAEEEANSARQDADHFRNAHSAACSDRDFARGESAAAREEAQRARAESQQWMQELLHTQRQNEALQGQIEHFHAETLRMESVLQLANNHAHNLNANIAAHEAAIAGLRGTIDEFTHSTSWRVTQPLRTVGRRLRQVKRVAGAVSRSATWKMGLGFTLKRTVQILQQEGFYGMRQRLRNAIRRTDATQNAMINGAPHADAASVATDLRSYSAWLKEFEPWDAKQRQHLQNIHAGLKIKPLISIVMPTYNTVAEHLEQAIQSVQAQIYPHWQLCIADDASPKPHVRAVLERMAAQDKRITLLFLEQNGHISKASNAAIGLAKGDYIAFLDHDDELSPHALLRVVQALEQQPHAKVMYSDEDKIDGEFATNKRRFDPYFKPDFNLGLLRSHNFMCHFAVYEAAFLRELGGLRTGFEGGQDYDLALRAVDATDAKNIVHLPFMLYHWRAAAGSTAAGHTEKSYAFTAGQRALTEHLARRGLAGTVEGAPEAPGMYRIRWKTPEPDQQPLVSIVIPTRNGEKILRLCLDSLKKTTYRAMEIIVVDNGSDEQATLDLLAERVAEKQIRVLRDDSPFNYSAINNRAVAQAKGEFVLLLNNDIEVVTPEWLDEMLGAALEDGVGCVGARLWYPNGMLQHGGVILVCGVAGHSHKYLPRGQHGYMGRAVLAQDLMGVTAACLLVRKSIYDEVGGLDEGFAVAFNDVDFCLRVHKAGYRNHWTPYAELIHHESLTRGHEDTPEKQARFKKEIDKMQARWPILEKHDDPCYSPNLTAMSEDFSFAWPPRRDLP